jgi:hypothetical protein
VVLVERMSITSITDIAGCRASATLPPTKYRDDGAPVCPTNEHRIHELDLLLPSQNF